MGVPLDVCSHIITDYRNKSCIYLRNFRLDCAALTARSAMQMLNAYCGVDRDSRGFVRLTICNAGSLNILGSAAIDGIRAGLEVLATDRAIRALVIAGQSERSMIGGADIKEMAKL